MQVVCDVLDSKLVNYIVLDNNSDFIRSEIKRKVYFGDATRPEVMETFGIGNARAVISTVSSESCCDQLVSSVRRNYPDVPVIARAVNEEHIARLQKTMNVQAMLTTKPKVDTYEMCNLPFGGEVLKAMGYNSFEVDSIVQDMRLRTEPNSFITESIIKTVESRLVQPPIFFLPPKGGSEAAMNLELPESMSDLPWRDRCKGIFEQIDKDAKGTVDFDQFASCIMQDSTRVYSTPPEFLFKEMVTPSSGQVTLEEFFQFVDGAKVETPLIKLKGA